MEKKLFILILISLLSPFRANAGYQDHRNRNLDSLEAILKTNPGPEILYPTLEQLASGCLQTDPHYTSILAHRLVSECPPLKYLLLAADGAVLLSNHYRGQGQHDSSLFYAVRAYEFLEQARREGYEPQERDSLALDNAYSRICGTLGNAYVMQEEFDTAIDYYKKALTVFEEHHWKESTSLLYGNLGYLYDEIKDYKKAEESYLKSIAVARETKDSLILARAQLSLGQFYVARGKYNRALAFVTTADAYYSKHEDEEFMGRIEVLDALSAVNRNQARLFRTLTFSALITIFLLIALFFLLRKLRIEKKALADTESVFEETLQEIPNPPSGDSGIKLNERERDIIRMLSEGMDSAQIADKLFLSKETVKWYRKRLLAKFGVSTSAAVVSEAIRRGIIQN